MCKPCYSILIRSMNLACQIKEEEEPITIISVCTHVTACMHICARFSFVGRAAPRYIFSKSIAESFISLCFALLWLLILYFVCFPPGLACLPATCQTYATTTNLYTKTFAAHIFRCSCSIFSWRKWIDRRHQQLQQGRQQIYIRNVEKGRTFRCQESRGKARPLQLEGTHAHSGRDKGQWTHAIFFIPSSPPPIRRRIEYICMHATKVLSRTYDRSVRTCGMHACTVRTDARACRILT